ncbi:MAG: GNAT family N-acetyltransferase [Betaproteobacteria bacterium]|nr:GNAT family N-acetyltransferase [Betaproteobacteria bacterium]
MSYFNQLEPDALIRHFLAYPPQDFDVWVGAGGMPLFAADFDLLTTLDPSIRSRVMRLPGYSYWRKYLQPKTCFAGTTVSEYALLPDDRPAEELADQLLREAGSQYPLLIVKDVPLQSPLLDARCNAFSQAFLQALKARDFFLVDGQALAWVPVDYADSDDYLKRLSSGRRKDLRRKLKTRSSLDIQVCSCGDSRFDDPAFVDLFYRLYLNVFRQSEIHFDLLTREFFHALLRDGNSQGVVFLYYHDGRLIGYNICFVVGDALIDKYVGFEYPAARECNLYHVSWFYNLEYAATHHLKYYIAGWTDPEIKAYLGARFSLTQHAVFVRNPLLRFILRRLSPLFESDKNWADGYKKDETSANS